MRDALERLLGGQDLSEAEAQEAMETVMRGEATPAQIGAFLTALKIKGEQVEEIAGFAKAMRKFAQTLPVDGERVIDTCGTGGDGARTFNVSTAAAIVAAAAGARVAKHGNRSVSSRSGSADVLSALGVEVDLTPAEAAECLEEVGLCFLFAPSYHGAMRHAMGPRRELGFRTVFNILGPLTNPAGAKRQVMGTYAEELVEKTARVLLRLGSRHAMVVHGLEDGLDELSVSGPSVVAEVKDGQLRTYTITPEEVGLSRSPLVEVAGGDAVENAEIIREVLEGRRGARRDIVVLNAGASLYVAGIAATLREGVSLAGEVLDNGRAKRVLERLIHTTKMLVDRRPKAMALEGGVAR
ncbi:MAG: anthranilate phosphoribosyltransferase [Alicyclobacillaceae bacterium]|nr:anthranilate phosphoribosyltransferase [Alicyclobacillaceae bacterium]